MAATGLFLVRSQQFANRMILARLDEVRGSLEAQRLRSAELQGEVARLTERVGRLEADNQQLRKQIAELLKRKPMEVASMALPPVINAAPLLPMAAPSVASAESIVIEPVPITWATDWSTYQPAGIIAPSPAIVLNKRMTDPDHHRNSVGGRAHSPRSSRRRNGDADRAQRHARGGRGEQHQGRDKPG